MPFLEVVGRYPEHPGSEETDRRTPRKTNPAAQKRGSLAIPLSRQDLLAQRRLQLAGVAALALVVLLAIVFPLRTVRITADGATITTRTRSVDERAVVAHAGVPLYAKDRIDASSGAIEVQRARDVALTVDGNTYAMRSPGGTVADLLDEAAVMLNEDDRVLLDGDAVAASTTLPGDVPLSQPITLEVRRAMPFTVVMNNQQLDLRSSASTISSALHDVGMRLGAGDEVQPPLDTPLSSGLEVRVDHARELVVTLPGGKSTVYTVEGTVGAALADSGLTLPADYRLDPPAETFVSAGLAVHVVGISTALLLETERIQSYLVYQPDPGLPPGGQRVVEGQDGVHYRQYQVVAQDGVDVSRELANEWDDPAAVDTIIYYSTAPVPTAAPVAAYSGDWKDLVCSYSWDCSWALAVIMCESGGNANAYNPAGYVGLFQIWEGFGSNLRDPATNIAAAFSLYQSGGPSNWPNCP